MDAKVIKKSGFLKNPDFASTLIIHKDRIRKTQRRKKFDQVRFCIDLRLLKNSILDRRFEDLLLSLLPHQRFKVWVGFGKHARLTIIHIRFFIIQRGDQHFGGSFGPRPA